MLCSASPSRPLDYMLYPDVPGKGFNPELQDSNFSTDQWKIVGVA
jgi:hypothetical protein